MSDCVCFVDWVEKLRSLLPRFPMTMRGACRGMFCNHTHNNTIRIILILDTKSRVFSEIDKAPYTLVSTPAQFRSLHYGRRKAIEVGNHLLLVRLPLSLLVPVVFSPWWLMRVFSFARWGAQERCARHMLNSSHNNPKNQYINHHKKHPHGITEMQQHALRSPTPPLPLSCLRLRCSTGSRMRAIFSATRQLSPKLTYGTEVGHQERRGWRRAGRPHTVAYAGSSAHGTLRFSRNVPWSATPQARRLRPRRARVCLRDRTRTQTLRRSYARRSKKEKRRDHLSLTLICFLVAAIAPRPHIRPALKLPALLRLLHVSQAQADWFCEKTERGCRTPCILRSSPGTLLTKQKMEKIFQPPAHSHICSQDHLGSA